MTAPETLMALAERVEQASGPDRELDALIAPLQGLKVVDEGHPIGRMCYDDIGAAQLLPRYTASLDAAMTLVPPLVLFTIENDGAWLRWSDCSQPNLIGEAQSVLIGRGGQAAALALTAAALRARAQEGK